MVKSDKNSMFRVRAVRHACLLCHVVKQCRSDSSFGENIVIKPHLEPLDLQAELIILIFLCNRMLRTISCLEFGIRQQRL